MKRLSVLVVTNLFPSNADPGYAPFNRHQFAELGHLADVEVLGVRPWPRLAGATRGTGSPLGLESLSASIGWGLAAISGGRMLASVADEETIDGLRVRHPRFFSIPGLPALNASLLAGALFPAVARTRKRIDVLLAAYAYPDGCAGVILGRALGLPVVVKCHGSDLNRATGDRIVRAQMELLLPRADQLVVVSKRLGERAESLGVPKGKIHVVYNGVDRARFRVHDRAAARKRLRLPLDRELVVAVAHLAEHKGTGDLLRAAKHLHAARPSAMVAFVGDGPMLPEVQDSAEHGSTTGVLAVGPVPQDEVAEWMAASDVVCLPSWDEGLPNVIREAHASGRPVVATAVGGVPEAVSHPELGALVPARDPEALAQALLSVLGSPRATPERILELGLVGTWTESAQALLSVLERAARPKA